MNSNNLIEITGKKQRQRKGRGMSSGSGKTSGRGQKGQRSRSGGRVMIGFEGGQTPLYMRIPKFGFHSDKNKDLFVINLNRINNLFNEGEFVSRLTMLAKNLFSKNKIKRVKILGTGKLTKKIDFATDLLFSKSARKKIELIK